MIKVLVVDDEPFIRQGLGILIDWNHYGYEIVGEAANGREALEKLKEGVYDLVITDIKMPEVSGIELIKRIRETNKEIKIIVLSGYYEFEYAKQAIKYQVMDYILKPIQKDELIHTLTEIQERAEKDKKPFNEQQQPTEDDPFMINDILQDIRKRGEKNRTPVLRKSQESSMNKEKMDELIESIRENDKGKINECLEDICVRITRMSGHKKMADIYMNYLLCELMALAKEMDSEVDQGEILQNINNKALEQFSATEGEEHFKIFVREFAIYLNQLRQNVFSGVLDVIEKEIHQNYKENLSLKSLSEKYYINSAYLGQIFKKKYNVSFKDYLNTYRIEKATQLLIRTNDKVYMIAEAVGYHNLDYFINKFVKLKGKTPLQYRKQFLNR